ncbi:MAG: molybdopterin dinucleotide binding domain-containing protein, partial [Chloroflexota bacterium]
IHVDPRFTRASAMADIYAPIRPGTDITFLGGLISYVIENDLYFEDYVVNYTNAATIISEDFEDTEDLDGVFSGLVEFRCEPSNGFEFEYDASTWQYEGFPTTRSGRQGASAQSGEADAEGQQSSDAVGGQYFEDAPDGPPFADLLEYMRPDGMPSEDLTLQDEHCVFQIIRRHFSRYTPEMVERITGCPRDKFLEVAEALTSASGPERTAAFCYAVAWTQHTKGVQMIGCAALLQMLLGNIGRPGGGILALRGHATIQGSTDVPTLYHSIHGYMAHPSALAPHETMKNYLLNETQPTGYWVNTPSFLVSYMKSMYGDAATAENDFGWDWHPKITGDFSHMASMVRMAQGEIEGMFCIGQNPATSLNGTFERSALRNLEWLVVKDVFETETAAFWYAGPEVQRGDVSPEDIDTEVFLLPSAQIGEMEGSFTNTQRWVQWHEKAADPPGDCRSDEWFTHQLALRLKALYQDSDQERDRGFQNLTWDFDYDPGEEPADTRIQGGPDSEKILKEINGYMTDDPATHLTSFSELREDGSTTCASWIYCGIFPSPDQNRARNREPDPPNTPGSHQGWAFAWPANRRILYNRASADLDGNPWSERKRWVWWDSEAGQWTGYDTPDFPTDKPPDAERDPQGFGLDAHSGTDPFIMMADGKGWLYTPSGMVDGPLPTHYEATEAPIENPLYSQDKNPIAKRWNVDGNEAIAPGDPDYPYVITTYRLTEHHLSGVMTRWLPWLAELQPGLFIEMSVELAAEKGINNTDFVRIWTPRGSIQAKALVTRRLRPLVIDNNVVHVVGMPFHWGYMGVVTGDATNDLTMMVGDPNVAIHEGKSFMCNLERA